MPEKLNGTPTMQGAVCPTPLPHDEMIVMGHGSGGKMSHDLITRLFQPPFDNDILRQMDDAGVVTINASTDNASTDNASTDDGSIPDSTRLAVSTDSHVVYPLRFPGGDIGRLAICGTVNDLAMVGARPLWLTAGFILEEGLSTTLLAEIAASMQVAAAEAGVQIVAGDTKVVEKGKGDGVYINTAGVGLVPAGRVISGRRAQVGDVVILSGPIGDHGIAVLSARGDLGFEADVRSDVAPLNGLVAAMLATGADIHVLRDPTRGGVASALNEIAQQANVAITLDEEAIPVRPAVAAACEMLGFDPLYIANEGKLLAILPAADAEKVLAAMHSAPYGSEAVVVGEVGVAPAGRLLVRTAWGSRRVVGMMAGEMLPRIC